MIVGLSGYARSGKDTVASLMPTFEHRSFAGKLKEMAWILNPMLEGGMRLQEVVQFHGWDKAKDDYQELRRFLQVLGTEVGREMIDQDIWVNLAMREIDTNLNTVFTDCRFPNEAKTINEMGGQVWRINRPGIEAVNHHASETALDGWDFDLVIVNDGTIIDDSNIGESANNLKEKVLTALASLL